MAMAEANPAPRISGEIENTAKSVWPAGALVAAALLVNLYLFSAKMVTWPEGQVASREVMAPRAVAVAADPGPGVLAGGSAIATAAVLYVREDSPLIRPGDVVSATHIKAMKQLGLYHAPLTGRDGLGLLAYFVLLFGGLTILLWQFDPRFAADPAYRNTAFTLMAVMEGCLFVLALMDLEAGLVLYAMALGVGLLLADSLLSPVAALLMFPVYLGFFVPGWNLGGAMWTDAVAGLVAYAVLRRTAQHRVFWSAATLAGISTLYNVPRPAGALTPAGISPALLSFALVAGGTATLTYGLTRFLSTTFLLSSRERLREILDPTFPLLRKLATQAPGTYAHSLAVAALAEQAAAAVGADPLLTRAGAMFHDVGKIKRPNFFIENQQDGKNPHEEIAPSMSAPIVMAHVRDGVGLARHYRLPEAIVEVIETHHGTAPTGFFYKQAAEDAAEVLLAPPGPEDFRYQCPKPRTREQVVIMLADTIEATVRSLREPTTADVEETVRRILQRKLEDGQLDEAEVPIADLYRAVRRMLEMLIGGLHSRPEYPHEEPTTPQRKENSAV